MRQCKWETTTTVMIELHIKIIKISNINFRDKPYSFSLSSGLAVFTDTVPNATAFRNMSITPSSDSSYNYSIKTM